MRNTFWLVYNKFNIKEHYQDLLKIKMPKSSKRIKINLIGKKLRSQYNVLSELGKGTFGTVYKCLDTTTNEHVAIKELNPKIASNEVNAFESLENADEKCKYLIEMLEWFEENKLAYLVYPVYGPNTEEAMKDNKRPFKLQDVQIMAKQLIEATYFLHKNKLLVKLVKKIC